MQKQRRQQQQQQQSNNTQNFITEEDQQKTKQNSQKMVPLLAAPNNKKGGTGNTNKVSIKLILSLLGGFVLVYANFFLGGDSSSSFLREDKSKTHHCWNDDFQPQHPVSIWTMLTDNPQYVQGAIKMGRAIQQHTFPKLPHDLVVMELRHKPLSDDQWKQLRAVGFQRCIVSPIPPPKLQQTRPDLREKFAVLHIWAMTVYNRIVFVDADTFPQNSIDHLFTMDLQGKPIGVTRDIRERKWVDTFNSGVFLINPSLREHQRLVDLLQSGMEFEYKMSDQGFLNEVYKNNWYEIGFVNNANLALYRFQREFWDQHSSESINIIHYTMAKPWTPNCKSKGPYGPLCDVWKNAN